jgi:MFS family permease
VKTTSDHQHLAITFQQERKRAVAQGVLETAASTFLMLIAIKWYHAGFIAKSLLASSANSGMILSVLVVTWVANRQWRLSQAASGFALAGGLAFLMAALFPSLPTLVAGGVFGLVCASCLIPLMTQLYQNHYPANERGRLFSRTTRYRIIAAILFSDLAGRFLTGRLQYHPSLLACYSLALLAMSVFLRQIPSDTLHRQDSPHLFQAFRHLKHDHFFRWTLHCWMILGFANLMMVALRVDYLANPRYGIVLSPSQIALLLGVIPNIARFFMSGIWGWLFDHVSFYRLRMVLNMSFALATLTFFTGETMNGFILGAVLYGIGIAGGDVAWALWVTKFSPPQHVAEYMSVHTFMTGLRGIIAPWVGFWIVDHFSITTAAWTGAIMILIATLMLLKEPKRNIIEPIL